MSRHDARGIDISVSDAEKVWNACCWTSWFPFNLSPSRDYFKGPKRWNSSSSWREAFSWSLPPLRSFARTVGPPLAAGPRSLLHPCCGRSVGSRWSMVGHRCVSTSVKVAHHLSSWCRFVGSGLLVHRVEVWRRAQRDPAFACERCTRRRTGQYDVGLHRWIRSHAIWCAGCIVGTVHGKNPVYSSRLIWGSRSQSHIVVHG